MRKLLVISDDIVKDAMKPGPHTFHKRHEDEIRAAVGSAMELVVATPEEAASHFADAEAIAAFPMRFPDVSKTPQIKWLHSFSAGVDKILTPEVIASDIAVSNSSGIHATPIAEHVIGFMLMCTRHFVQTVRNQEKHSWQPDEALDELHGKTILIVGMGEIGTEVARLAKPFGTKILALSRSARTKPDFVDEFATSEKLDAMLPQADFVVITLPGTPETHHLFDETKFALMKSSAIVINIGRGSIIDEKDLTDALNKKIIAGAALDVFEKEPLPQESPLWDMPNVIITPHDSGLSQKYMDRAVALFCKNSKAYLAGEPLPTEVDKKLGY